MPRPRNAARMGEVADTACDEGIVHVAEVRAARDRLPSAAQLERLVPFFAALGDPARLRIAAALEGGELCVCDLAAVVGLSESATSHQLRWLRSLGVVRPRREGRRVYYALDDPHVEQLLALGLAHVAHAAEDVR